MAEPLENTLIYSFIHPFHYSGQFPYPCIWNFIHSPDTQQTSEMSICTSLMLDLSFHIIASLPYMRTVTSNDLCRTLAQSSCKPLALTFLQHSASFVPDLARTHPNYSNSETFFNCLPSTQTSHSNPSSFLPFTFLLCTLPYIFFFLPLH